MIRGARSVDAGSSLQNLPVRTKPHRHHVAPHRSKLLGNMLAARIQTFKLRAHLNPDGEVGRSRSSIKRGPYGRTSWMVACSSYSAVGIDLGTTSSAIAVVGPDGRAKVHAVVPSVVHFSQVRCLCMESEAL